jgi:hypothetical protein
MQDLKISKSIFIASLKSTFLQPARSHISGNFFAAAHDIYCATVVQLHTMDKIQNLPNPRPNFRLNASLAVFPPNFGDVRFYLFGPVCDDNFATVLAYVSMDHLKYFR